MTVAVSIGRTDLRYGHAYQVGIFRENYNGIIVRVTPVFDDQFCQRINIGRHLWDQESISPGGNSRLHRCETRVSPKHTDDSRLETNTVIGPGYVVIHGFGDAPDRDTLCRKYGAVTQCVVAPDHHQSVQIKKAQVRQYLVSEINPIVRRMTLTVGR